MKISIVKYFLIGIAIAVLVFISCAEDITGQKNQNIPPETTVFVQSDTMLNRTASIQTIYWDGTDADGFVVGFYYTWAMEDNAPPAEWIWTTSRSGTFPLRITGADTSYRFRVKAVDNAGAEDTDPAEQWFPIKNSPPTISWTDQSSIPDTTFTVASFVWSASDLDGDSTIASFEYSLDDTTNWRTISGTRRQLTLNADSGLTAGNHSFYIRTVDVADARSPIIRMPEDINKSWYVKDPQGRYLLIDDNDLESQGTPDAFYKSLLNSLLPQFGETYSYWNIEKSFPSSPTQFVETMKLFDRVIWYTDVVGESDPHFIRAQTAIPEFRNKGGKIIYTAQFSSKFGSQGDPLGFSPVDSLVFDTNGNPFRIFTNDTLFIDPAFQDSFPTIPLMPPQLKVYNNILGVLALIPEPGAIPMYRYNKPNGPQNLIFVVIGRNNNTHEYDFVFSGAPLHSLRKNSDFAELFRIILEDIFGP